MMETIEIFVGVSELAVALAGFTGIVVAFGGKNAKTWNASDRLRLSFLLESSFTAAGFSLLALLGLSAVEDKTLVWNGLGVLWTVATLLSLLSAHHRMRLSKSVEATQNIYVKRLITSAFVVMIFLQISNLFLWQQMSVFLAALILNLTGAATQFVDLIGSAFNGEREQPAEGRELPNSTYLRPLSGVVDKTVHVASSRFDNVLHGFSTN